MSRYTSIAVSCLIFLIGLFLFKAVFPALGITLVFLLLITFLEVVWRYRDSVLILGIANLILAAVVALTVYTLTYLPVEFLATEILLIMPKIPPWIGLFALLALVALFSLVNWSRWLKAKSGAWVLVVLVVFSGFVYGIYRSHKLAREYLPKIYRVNPNFGLQAEIVKLKGVNFFPVWKRGKVVLGEQEMVIKSWGEEVVVAEQPVPNKFGQVELYIVRKDGVESNKVPFEIKDPGKLRN